MLFRGLAQPAPPSVMTLILLLVLLQRAAAQCEIHLPTASTPVPSPSPSVPIPNPNPERVLNGLAPVSFDYDNIVVIAQGFAPSYQTRCVGSLIAPDWVVTAAQCFVFPGTYEILHGGSSSLSGIPHEIKQVIPHPGWTNSNGSPSRDDIQLIQLQKPIGVSPSPTPVAVDDSREAQEQPMSLSVQTARQDGDGAPSQPTPPPFNYMWVNTNRAFATAGMKRYLRVKGFGLFNRPEAATESLLGEERKLRIADLMTANCDDGFGNDQGRRLCTKPDNDCGPCFGDTGAPLYEVDSSGRVGVLVGIVTFGLPGIADTDADSVCTSGEKPVIYTAIAPYVDWIKSHVGATGVTFYNIPEEGLSETDLAPKETGLTLAAKVSIITLSSLILIGVIAFLLFTCVLRMLRRRRKRWAEGIRQEESFVKGSERDAGIVDPFEGIVDDHKEKRLSVSSLGRAAVKGATEFSARSIEAVRAMLMRMDEEDMYGDTREPMDGAPQWLPAAWEKLFRPPSRAELEHIHKVRTQRVVDDVLEGGDKSVEPSLEDVAFKSARDEANLEAAWKKLEIKTSMRNLQEEASASELPMSPPLSRKGGSSSRKLSGNMDESSGKTQSGRLGSRKRMGSRSNSGKIKSPGPSFAAGLSRTDTLLAAFASIDAESEQVAEETELDSTQVQEIALTKRTSVFDALRKKLNLAPPSSRALDKGGGSEQDLGADDNNLTRQSTKSPQTSTPRLSVRSPQPSTPILLSPPLSPPPPQQQTSTSLLPTIHALAEAAASSTHRALSTRNSSGFSANTIPPTSRSDNSMGMDYFSEEYLSSSDEDDAIFLEEMARRYTTDRREDSTPTVHEQRTRQIRSFQNLDAPSMDLGADEADLSNSRSRQ